MNSSVASSSDLTVTGPALPRGDQSGRGYCKGFDLSAPPRRPWSFCSAGCGVGAGVGAGVGVGVAEGAGAGWAAGCCGVA